MRVIRQWSRLPLKPVESPSKPVCMHGDECRTRSPPEMPSNLSWSWFKTVLGLVLLGSPTSAGF